MNREPDLFISTTHGDGPTVHFLNDLFLQLADERISDLHLREDQGRWSFRVRRAEGMSEAVELSPEVGRFIDQKIRTRTSDSRSGNVDTAPMPALVPANALLRSLIAVCSRDAIEKGPPSKLHGGPYEI